jgi:hypothetical protein
LHTSDGFRLVSVSASPGFVGYERSDASMSVGDSLAPSAQSDLVFVGSTTIRVHRRCVAARKIVLSAKGLPGPPGIFRANYDCESKQKSILVRVRAVAASSTPWKRQPPAHLELRKAVSSAQLSVQTPSGQSLGYVTIADKKVRIWISPDCVRD